MKPEEEEVSGQNKHGGSSNILFTLLQVAETLLQPSGRNRKRINRRCETEQRHRRQLILRLSANQSTPQTGPAPHLHDITDDDMRAGRCVYLSASVTSARRP